MRDVVLYELISLDGVAEGPGEGQWFADADEGWRGCCYWCARRRAWPTRASGMTVQEALRVPRDVVNEIGTLGAHINGLNSG